MFALTSTTACQGLPNGEGAGSHEGELKSLQIDPQAERATIPVVHFGGKSYVSARALVDTLEYESQWNEAENTFQIGDTDVVYELTVGSTKAWIGEEEIELAAAPVIHEQQTYLPVSVIEDVFGTDMSYELSGNELSILRTTDALEPFDEDVVLNENTEQLDFSDDPDDPFKDEEDETVMGKASVADETGMDPLNEQAVPAALKNINLNSVIVTARHYLGVKYKFGAGAYSKTRRFDCSSFTRFIYGKYRVKLPRTARSQAKQGRSVSRTKLRKGDLLYFYVPGRFKSNKKVGHVGIYMGNMKMIHASPIPKNGVQITNINKAYWKKTFIRAKRVAR
jgi:cell wall-associated NlpC family hydrolase